MDIKYGYTVLRPEMACVIEQGRISAYGWLLIISGWIIKALIVTAIIVGLATGYLPLKPFLMSFVIGLLIVTRR